MSRQPTVSTDSVAQDQIRAFVDRILRMKEEAKAINDDIREIYAEAKGNGFDKTVLGKLVSYVGKREKSAAAMEEADALFDIYLAAYDGTPSRTHAHAREGNQHRSGLAGPASGGDARTANTKPASEHEPVTSAADEATLTPVKAGQASLQGEGGGEDAPASLADTIRQDEPADAVVGGTQPVSDRFHSEPGNGRAGETPVVAPRQGGEEPGTLGSLSAAPSNIVRIPAKPLRPYCHPDHTGVCASPGGKVHCHRCEALHAAGAREVVAGGKQIEHHGSINQ